eukprot:1788793-Amphidinium_carterae.1
MSEGSESVHSPHEARMARRSRLFCIKMLQEDRLCLRKKIPPHGVPTHNRATSAKQPPTLDVRHHRVARVASRHSDVLLFALLKLSLHSACCAEPSSRRPWRVHRVPRRLLKFCQKSSMRSLACVLCWALEREWGP